MCKKAFMAQRNRLRPFYGNSVVQFQSIEDESQQVIGQVLALTEPVAFNDGNEQSVHNENQNVGAIVDGYDPGMADVYIEIEGVEIIKVIVYILFSIVTS
ncbi:unnamed protein product [Euphydryas editha]|uniref:Uncharacterized protein n=1 Tax=Euphydryas editha TaxID=104508 RepID=A0AAU9TNH8_EUPED|nr:unnamed protein product [Euphydryas editha]